MSQQDAKISYYITAIIQEYTLLTQQDIVNLQQETDGTNVNRKLMVLMLAFRHHPASPLGNLPVSGQCFGPLRVLPASSYMTQLHIPFVHVQVFFKGWTPPTFLFPFLSFPTRPRLHFLPSPSPVSPSSSSSLLSSAHSLPSPNKIFYMSAVYIVFLSLSPTVGPLGSNPARPPPALFKIQLQQGTVLTQLGTDVLSQQHAVMMQQSIVMPHFRSVKRQYGNLLINQDTMISQNDTVITQ